MKYGHALDDRRGEVRDDIHRAAIRNLDGIPPRRTRERNAIFRIGEKMGLVYVERMQFGSLAAERRVTHSTKRRLVRKAGDLFEVLYSWWSIDVSGTANGFDPLVWHH
jgi:hypothetical protein